MNDPIAKFSEWFELAKSTPEIAEANAMALATASKAGFPSVRIMLLKGFDKQGFVFFTNFEGRKSLELKENPNAALNFFWQPLGRQVRIEGVVEQVSDKEADEYYNTRPFISRIGAHASEQSRPLNSRATLMKKVEELQKIYSEENPPPRPQYWSGWRVIPKRIEFWQAGEFRLHDREVYNRIDGDDWRIERLYP